MSDNQPRKIPLTRPSDEPVVKRLVEPITPWPPPPPPPASPATPDPQPDTPPSQKPEQ